MSVLKETGVKKQVVNLKKENNLQLDHIKEKKQVILKYVNNIYTNMNKTPIIQLKDFQHIDRLDIITEKNKKMLTDMESEILKHFSKRDSCYDKDRSLNCVLNCLRRMVAGVGMELKRRAKSKTVKCRVEAHNYYSIV